MEVSDFLLCQFFYIAMAFDSVPKLCKIKILFLLTMYINTDIIAGRQTGPQIKPLDRTSARDVSRDFSGLDYKLLLVGDKNYALPTTYRKLSSFYYNFKPKQNEIFVVSSPNAGQMWAVEVIWLLQHHLAFDEADRKPASQKASFFEAAMFTHKKTIIEAPSRQDPAHRVIRTHLPLSLIPQILNSPNKIIYMARNPKDNLESEFSEAKRNASYGFRRDIEEFWGFYERNLVMYNPYWAHIHEGYNVQNRSNVLFLYIEEYVLTNIRKIAAFLGTHYQEYELNQLSGYIASRIRINRDRWVFNTGLNDRINKWIKDNIGPIWFPHIHLYYP